MESKPWYLSKTVWANAIALVGAIAIPLGLGEVKWLAISTPALAVINLIIRLYTGEPITGTPADKS